MKQTLLRLIPLFFAMSIMTGCGSLLGVNIDFVGEKTALEKQVLGNYQALGRDLSVYSSVRAVEPDGSISEPPKMSKSQKKVMEAIKNRKYNRDDLNVLLLSGAIGEANTGLIEIRDLELIPKNTIGEDLAREVIEEENSDRGVILERLMTTTPGVTEDQRGEVSWIFANLNRDLAPEGSMIQERNGMWRKK